MQPHLFVAVLLLLATSCLRADLTLTQKLESPAQPQPMTIVMKVKGDMMRNDMGTTASTLMDLKSGGVVSLIHSQKAALRMPAELLKMAREAAAQKSAGGGATDIKPTGRKETINGFSCEEYAGTSNGHKIEVWLAKNIPEATLIQEHLKKLDATANPAGSALKQLGIEGLPVRTTIEIPGMGKTTMTLLSIVSNPLPDSDFKVPAGYSEMQAPVLPSPGAPTAP